MTLLSLPTLLMADRKTPRFHALMCDRIRETASSVRKCFCDYQSAQLATTEGIILHTVCKYHAAVPPLTQLPPPALSAVVPFDRGA